MNMAERGSTSEPIQTGSYRPEGYKPATFSHKLKNALGVLIIGGGLAAGCAPKEGVHPTQMPTMGGETPVTLVDPTLAPTEYVLPGVSTETSTIPTQAALETPPAQIEGVMVLPGIEPSAGGPDLIKNPYSTGLRDVINAAKFGLVSGENVSVKTGQTCISNVPEKLWHDTLPKNEQLLKKTVNGVATYVDQQVLAEVPIPADTKDATYSCALGYTKNNGDYIDGTLFQLLIKTNTADGSQEVVATMKAGFSTEDKVEVKNGAVVVNGETQGWTAQAGMELPVEAPELKAGIPATMEECNVMELQYNADGTINRDVVSSYMKELSTVEHQWLDEQGITVKDVSDFNLNKESTIGSIAELPYPYIKLDIAHAVVTSCTRVTYNGHEYMMYGIAGRRNGDSNEIGILHVLYDDKGKKMSLEASGALDYYNTHFTPEIVFAEAQNNKIQEISIFLKGYGQTTDQSLLDRWEASQAFATINNPTGDKNLDSDERLMFYIDPTIQASLDEEKQWIDQLEAFVLPAQTVAH